MRNQYQTYQDFMIQQPFFSFDVLHYEEQTQQEPFAARYYAFTTPKVIRRTQDSVFMCCIPDGCLDIVFIRQHGTYKMEFIGSPFLHKSLIVYPDACYFGARLKPGMYFPGEPVCLKELTNTETFVPQLSTKLRVLLERLFDTQVLTRRMALFQEYLQEFEPETYQVEEAVQHALYLISASCGTWDMNSVAKEICYSERHLTRLFSESVGYSPKMFARIARFQRALYQMVQCGGTDAVSSYLDALNYADQAHFQREFKEFTGMTPRHFSAYLRACGHPVFPTPAAHSA